MVPVTRRSQMRYKNRDIIGIQSWRGKAQHRNTGDRMAVAGRDLWRSTGHPPPPLQVGPPKLSAEQLLAGILSRKDLVFYLKPNIKSISA